MAEFAPEFKDQAIGELKQLGENVAKDAAEAVFNIAEFAIKASENKYDDMLLVALPKLKEVVMGFIDQINVEEQA